ncbi:MAG TPA: pyridoxamine 5'-phosphate oxidase family protein [Nitrosopumilaceae archaeon]|nr:pyridoxamine 5'-phosphate oxidase family protein [Nitrosopumilaceae archaeon]
MKIINAIPGFGPQLSEQRVRDFLVNSKLNLQLATIDSKGEPAIHPVWYIFENEKLYVATPKKSKKAQNALKNNLIYYSIDDENMPYKGVKGKATVRLLESIDSNLNIAEKIILKYMGSLENDIGKFIISQIKEGNEAILEITPKYYSAWSFGN